jgi:predicted transcriptional regulator of viral defense system
MIAKMDFPRYVAGRIYSPSYISLHTALSIYGMIPEAVTQITSVTTLKTASFENALGQYSYKTVKPQMFWGYKPMEMRSADGQVGQTWFLAHPEKALLDLLYLYPFYNSEEELLQLRLDEDFMMEELNKDRLEEYLLRFDNKALNARVKKLKKVFDI